MRSIEILDAHVNSGRTCELLREQPKDGMIVSRHIAEVTMKKAMSLQLFLRLMHLRDDELNSSVSSDMHAQELAKNAGQFLGVSKSLVYRCYKEWRHGQEERAIMATAEGKKPPFDDRGWFENDHRGSYERNFILVEEDLKLKFMKWMRKNLRKLSVDLAWKYINSTLLKNVSENTLLAHGICLPICKDTAWRWMKKCEASRTDTQKTYYNDHHQKPDVIAHRHSYISNLRKLQKRMRVWKILSEVEEKKYLEKREWSPYKLAMAIGERCEVDGKIVYAHHIDDQGGWQNYAVLHPNFVPGPKPPEDEWKCEWKHDYARCKCHLELREYGQDESTYHSGDNPSSRWAVSGRSYAINKSKGVARMVSAFKDYTSRGMCLKMSEAELEVVNEDRVGKKYKDGGKPMEPLKESPGIVVIEPTKDGDGYWNFDKMSVQTQDVMHAMDVLECNIQQLHQFDWSSGHAKSREGGLLITNMNLNYGGVGGKKLRDTELTNDDVGEGDATMFKVIDEDGKVRWFLDEPTDVENITITKHDCRVYAGDVQSMSFGEKESHPLPPFNFLDAPCEDAPDLDKKGEHKKTKSGTLKLIKGYAGKAKGLAQVLWERGLYKPKMKKMFGF